MELGAENELGHPGGVRVRNGVRCTDVDIGLMASLDDRGSNRGLKRFQMAMNSIGNGIRYGFMMVIVSIMASGRGDEPVVRIADGCFVPLVRIAPGHFDMGRREPGAFAKGVLSWGEQADGATEGPVRRVAISRGFWIGKYKITSEQFCRFLNTTSEPDRWVNVQRFSNVEILDGKYVPKEGRGTFPVNGVPWAGAKAFCDWLSQESGRTVRLPTEAEWEYVARGSEGRRKPWGSEPDGEWTSTEGSSVDAFSNNVTPEGVVGLVDYVVGEWCSDFYGVRYLPNDRLDPRGPEVEELPVASDLRWLASVNGVYHVQRGRVRRSEWSTTARSFGDRADDGGIYGFRIVVEEERE